MKAVVGDMVEMAAEQGVTGAEEETVVMAAD